MTKDTIRKHIQRLKTLIRKKKAKGLPVDRELMAIIRANDTLHKLKVGAL